MANALYPKTKAAMLQGGVNLITATVKALLIDLADYAYDAAHDFLNDVPVAARVAVSGALSGKAINDLGQFDSGDPIFTSVAGDQLEAVILFIDTGDESTSRLVLFQDTGVTGMPLTPDGNNVQIIVAAAGWFTL
jgi:hypothetical protein